MGAGPTGGGGGFVVQPATSLSAATVALAAEAGAEGFRFADRLVAAWTAGVHRFAGSGEVWLEARRLDVLLGFGGLSRDPYTDVPGVGRLRHLFVRRQSRRCGVGRALATSLLARAGSFGRVRVRAADGTGGFYERVGFVAVSERDATHVAQAL